MTNYIGTKTFTNTGLQGLGLSAPVVMVHTGTGTYAVGDTITFNVVKPGGVRLVAAFASMNKAASFTTGMPFRNVVANNTASTIVVTLGTAIALNDTVSVLGIVGV